MNRLHAVVRKCGLPAMAATLLMALSGTFQPINAQINEWLDQAGDRHFENSLEQVPEAQRAQARAVVSAAITGSASRPTDESVPTDTQANNNVNAADDAFADGWDAGFRAGWETGYRVGADEAPECPAQPVVLQSQSPVVVNVPPPEPFDPSGAYYQPPYYGSVGIPFDDGSSRGFNNRTRMQELRALERGW